MKVILISLNEAISYRDMLSGEVADLLDALHDRMETISAKSGEEKDSTQTSTAQSFIHVVHLPSYAFSPRTCCR